MTKLKDLTGQKFGRLTVISRAENTKTGQARWNCICSCGNETIVRSAHLIDGHTRSCGCLNKDIISEHIQLPTNTREYNIWVCMKQRCLNPNNKSYKWYGQRGIKVCDRWLDEENGYENFITDLGNSPGIDYSLERVDHDGDYCPENCIWIKKAHQNRNTRKNVISGIDEANTIREEFKNGKTAKLLSEEHNCSIGIIRSIVNNKTWKNN